MNIPADKRFTVTREYIGAPTAKYVLRFCGDYIFSFDTKDEAVKHASLSIQEWNSLVRR